MKKLNAAALAVSPVLLLALRAPAPAMAQDTTPPTVTDIVAKDASGGSTPLPGAVLDFAPSEIVVTFSEAIDPDTVNVDTFRFVGSGGDGTFDDGNEVEIVPAPVTVTAADTTTIDVSGVQWTNDVCRLLVFGADANASLVGHWKLDEASGTTAYDSSASSNHADMVSSPVWRPTEGRIGGALDFDGIDDRVSADVTGLPAAKAPQSIALWLKYPTTPSDIQCVVNVSDFANGSSVSMGFRNGKFAMWVYGGGVRTVEPPSAGEWHHFVYTFDSVTDSLFVDGVSQMRSTMTHNPGVPVAFHLGGFPGYDEYYCGLIDDVRIYDRALSANEIQALAGLASSVTDAAGNVLDGDYSGSLPSGDGTAGGDFVCTFEITAPTVLATSPAADALNVPVAATIEVIFSRAMDQVSTEGALVVSGGVTGTCSWAGDTVVFTPSEALEYSRYYTVTVTTEAKDATGVPLAETCTFAFTTAAEPQAGDDDGPCGAGGAGSPGGFLAPLVILALVLVPWRRRSTGLPGTRCG